MRQLSLALIVTAIWLAALPVTARGTDPAGTLKEKELTKAQVAGIDKTDRKVTGGKAMPGEKPDKQPAGKAPAAKAGKAG